MYTYIYIYRYIHIYIYMYTCIPFEEQLAAQRAPASRPPVEADVWPIYPLRVCSSKPHAHNIANCFYCVLYNVQ